MKLPLYHVDAFTDRVFSGNPAAICPLNQWLDDQTMLAIAAENNLSETAFCVREGEQYGLRWFAPKSEVQLCGHATLATGFVVLNYLQQGATTVTFRTCSGLLSVKQDGEFLEMDLPLIPAQPCSAPPDLISGLDPQPRRVLESGESAADRNYFVVYGTEDEVRSAKPNLSQLEKLHPPASASRLRDANQTSSPATSRPATEFRKIPLPVPRIAPWRPTGQSDSERRFYMDDNFLSAEET